MAALDLLPRTSTSFHGVPDPGLPFTDEELVAQALAADPDPEVPDGAVPVWQLSSADGDLLLPTWYMPSPMVGCRRFTGWRRRVIIGVVAAFLLIDAAGLCSTYGAVVLA
jgi:hypothetical protein